MPSVVRIREKLPGLWRPEVHHEDLLARFLRAAGTALDDTREEMNRVMRAHWYRFADHPQYDPFVLRSRDVAGLPAPDPLNPDDRAEMDQFEYLLDLARLGSLLSLPPWREPPPRELVAAYRLRLRRFVRLYRNGLGTIEAVRAITEAFLLPDISLPLAQRDRTLSVEECVALAGEKHAVVARGAPSDLVGPLMRWDWTNAGLAAVAPTLYVQGVTPAPGEVSDTEMPLIELYLAAGVPVRLGVAYNATLAADQTLRLRPSYLSWLGSDNGLLRAESAPIADTAADPTAPGPWTPPAGAPAGTVSALLQTADRFVWAAVGAELWRHDGQVWALALTASADILCVAEDGQELLLGTADGLARVALYAQDGVFTAAPVSTAQGQAVNALLRVRDGQWWIGRDDGAFVLGATDTLITTALAGTAVFALAEHANGTLYVGGELGLFQYQPGTDHWYWYRGESESDQVADWERLNGVLPDANDVFLPVVRGVYAGGPDASVWLATDAGIARYRARHEVRLAYKTLLEAFPDVTDGPATAVTVDARNLVWFGTSRGVLRYDGRDLVQFQDSAAHWLSMGRADQLYPDEIEPAPRGAWRFNRGLGTWQQFDESAGLWTDPQLATRTGAGDNVRAILWTDHVAADLGSFDGVTFTVDTPADTTALKMRFKPAEDRVVDGGVPAVPRIPPGQSTWRYLALEPPGFTAPAERPFWSREGRLFAPPERDAPYPGRYNSATPPPPESLFDDVVFAYDPAARVWFEWALRQPLNVLVRLYRRTPNETVDPAIFDRVWQGIERVRPAGVRALLAIDETIVRGV